MPNRATILTTCFAIGIVSIHALLWIIFPNKGMGGIGLTAVIWPLLVFWAGAFFLLVRRFPQLGSDFLLLNVVLMMLVSIALYPQDTPASFGDKLNIIRAWIS